MNRDDITLALIMLAFGILIGHSIPRETPAPKIEYVQQENKDVSSLLQSLKISNSILTSAHNQLRLCKEELSNHVFEQSIDRGESHEETRN
jgi:hypothetical protein